MSRKEDYEAMALLSVVICTHNRANDVSQCLSFLMPQIAPMGLSVILVDSCSDYTQSLKLTTLADKYSIVLIREDKPGLSIARNTGAANSHAKWIVYLDDDTVPSPSWAVSIHEVLKTLPDDVGVIGGKILPKWPAGLAYCHITDRWKLLLSCVERDGHGDIASGYTLAGANFAVRKSAWALAGGFVLTLGRTGEKLLSGEESYMIEALRAKGIRSLYDSRFEVLHCISADRLTEKWAQKRAYWEGYSRVRISQALSEPIPANMGIPKLIATIVLFATINLVWRDVDRSIRGARAYGSLRAQLESPR